MKAAHRAQINRANAKKSTGPKSADGKQKAAMNAFKHGLTCQRMILLDHEVDACRRLGAALQVDYNPENEIEKQLVQHVVDCNMRLHRSAAIDSSLMNAGMVENSGDAGIDPLARSVLAQTRSWVTHSDSFDKLGRYEGRIFRQWLRYIRELTDIQNVRKSLEAASEKRTEVHESNKDNNELASFRKTPLSDRLPRFMTAVSLGVSVSSAAEETPSETSAPITAAATANSGL